jgi:arginase
MTQKHVNLLYPQWQGAGKNKSTLISAGKLKNRYLKNVPLEEVPVDTSEDLVLKNNIWGYDPLLKQMQYVSLLLDKKNPDTLFTVGGGDDIEIIPISWMNHKLNGDMTLVFFDAHGDLNSPESSPSKRLYGMPLRTVLGEGDPGIEMLMKSKVNHDQVIMIGTRDCDEPEKVYIKEKHLQVLPSEQVNKDPGALIEALRKRHAKNLYVHIDIDVIDPREFPYQPVPAPNGVHVKAFLSMLKALKEEFTVSGMCLLGCAGLPEENLEVLSKIFEMGTSL